MDAAASGSVRGRGHDGLGSGNGQQLESTARTRRQRGRRRRRYSDGEREACGGTLRRSTVVFWTPTAVLLERRTEHGLGMVTVRIRCRLKQEN
ncbi:hypothetical protein M0R45_036486 [Rubus argutus]|uniref:Uncharacterized protein n=1 Tax=Rubus argutus TaxID=59490 RepID=A0AAW1VX98_RUBAR